MATTMAMDGAGAPYPVNLDVPYPQELSRGLLLVKWLLAIPHLAIVYVLSAVFSILSFIAIFAVLFTGGYPEGMFRFNVGIRRWMQNTFTYVLLLRDEYPPFSLDAGQYPVAFDIEYPASTNRFAPLYQWLLAIPHLIVVSFLILGVVLVTFIAWFAILFTGTYPESLFKFVVGTMRWSERTNTYVYFMTSEYPPFSLDA